MKQLTPIKAIRAKCMDCTCNQPKEIRECPIIGCPLWPYRMGHRPKPNDLIQIERKGAVTDAAAHVG
jgi:hypothetical protein